MFGFDVCYMLPMGFPTTGQSIRFEMFGSEGALLIDDDHREQMLYTEQGHQNAYAGEQEVNLYFLGSQSAGEWADGRMFGRVAEETRTWLDYLTAGTPCHLSTGKEALVTLAATLAIEEASRTGEAVAVETTLTLSREASSKRRGWPVPSPARPARSQRPAATPHRSPAWAPQPPGLYGPPSP